MASRITVTPDQLITSARKFQTGANDTERLLKQLNNEVNNLQSEWQGAAHSAFFEQYKQLQGPLNKFVTVLNEINTQLTGVAKTMEDVDQKIASKMR